MLPFHSLAIAQALEPNFYAARSKKRLQPDTMILSSFSHLTVIIDTIFCRVPHDQLIDAPPNEVKHTFRDIFGERRKR